VRIVLDTNVVLSALLWRGTPHRLREAIRAQPSAKRYQFNAVSPNHPHHHSGRGYPADRHSLILAAEFIASRERQ
jgi:hypothetical protein